MKKKKITAAPVVFFTWHENMWCDILFTDELKGSSAVLQGAFHSSHTNPLTLNCTVLCADPDTACFSNTELVGSGQIDTLQSVLLPSFFVPPPPPPANRVTHWNWLEEHMALPPPRAAEMLALISSVLIKEGIVRNSFVLRLWCKHTSTKWKLDFSLFHALALQLCECNWFNCLIPTFFCTQMKWVFRMCIAFSSYFHLPNISSILL